MIEHDFGMARATVLEEEGRYVAAAKQYWQEGQNCAPSNRFSR